MPKLEKGLVQVYTGDGKGKTSAAFGLALRAIGRGLKVYIIQFIKGGFDYGELYVVEKLPNLTVKYDLVILDEINIAVSLRLIDLKEVVKLIKNKPSNVELILTGRYAPKEIIESADLVTEMKEVKHPYTKGLPPRKGIEF